jgi:hypothetical protein
MPTVLRRGGLRFFFYSDEGTPREPLHIHVRQGDRETKLWLRPGLPVAYNYGFSRSEIRELREVIEEDRERIETAWDAFFG